MNKYLQLFRVNNAVMGTIGMIVAVFMAVGTDIGNHLINLVVSAVVVFCFICGGNALNDGIDAEIDKVAHPERPVPSGRMTAEHARKVGIVMLALAAIVSVFTFEIPCIVIVIVADILMVAYETRLKQRGFVGNVTIAVLTGMVFLLAGAVIGNVEANAIIALMACLVSIGREIAKDIEDMEGDEGRHTLPMAIGVRNASILASVFFILGPVFSIIPLIQQTYGPLFYVVVAADAIFLYCAYIVFSDQHKAQKMAKIAMLVALVSFILGVFHF
ncbi:MAG: UbiA family prenyltransferase [archaeon]|nr:UbiA family prenyltransferase [archaeon]